MDLVGLRFEAGTLSPPRNGLLMASRTAGVSCKAQLGASELAKALVTGNVPAALVPHVSTFLDEAPLPLVISAVEEAARRGGVPPKRIWRHVVRWAHELRLPRRAWA